MICQKNARQRLSFALSALILPHAPSGGKGGGGVRKHGYSVNLAILLGVAMSGVLLPAGDAFGCKWFKVCGYTPGGLLPPVESSAPGCIAVNAQSFEIGADGCVRFQLCIAPFVLVCQGCPADVNITLTQPGLPPRILKAKCTTCGFPVVVAVPQRGHRFTIFVPIRSCEG